MTTITKKTSTTTPTRRRADGVGLTQPWSNNHLVAPWGSSVATP
jgi:hypothetical protein